MLHMRYAVIVRSFVIDFNFRSLSEQIAPTYARANFPIKKQLFSPSSNNDTNR